MRSSILCVLLVLFLQGCCAFCPNYTTYVQQTQEIDKALDEWTVYYQNDHRLSTADKKARDFVVEEFHESRDVAKIDTGVQ